ncbi:MAG TPA: hypothetical protein ENI87_09655 [bacterium]|nr:hypothetical protein [bacterium]
MTAATHVPAAERLLPRALWQLPLARLRLAEEVAERLADHGLLTIADALQLPETAFVGDEALAATDLDHLRTAIAQALADGLRQFEGAHVNDWPTLRAQLFGPLDDESRELLAAAVGLDGPARSRQAMQQLLGQQELDEALQAIRSTLMQHAAPLLQRMQAEVEAEFEAFDGVLYHSHAKADTLVTVLGNACGDPETGLRLVAFCLPHLCHLHRGVLHAMPSRRFRELLRVLPQLVPQHRLPLAIADIADQLRARGIEVPTGSLMHVLRSELRVAIELDGTRGEVAVPDPRRPGARLLELLEELGEPTELDDLVFAYRERFRFASQQRLLRHLAGSTEFVRVGETTWSLRRWHETELADIADTTERVVRRLCSAKGRQDVLALARGEGAGERGAWLVLDALAGDPRVRLLGRGEACPADQQQSSVMQRLTRAFRRAAGDVVESLFLANQPAGQRRLVERLLEHNRAFVRPEPDRIDTLCNYPFNQERLTRLNKLVVDHLQQRAGYAHAAALKDLVDQTDLGGRWLTPQLLAEVLRRHGPFEVLAPGIIALKSLQLPASLARRARQALRQAGEALTIADVVRARPELAEFTDCLAELLLADPLVQSPDGRYFVL